MRKLLLATAMLVCCCIVHAQPVTEVFYQLPEDTMITIDEIDLWEPLKTLNYEVIYCNYFVFTGEDSLVIVHPPKGKRVAFKGIMLRFSGSQLFNGAVIFSTPFSKTSEMTLASIRLMLIDNSLVELDRAWLLDAGYYETINRLIEILQCTTIKTTQN